MAHVEVERPDFALERPMLVDGLPGMGLIGKLVADHLVDEFEMEYYAGVFCEGIPSVAAYRTNQSAVRPPVQMYADPQHDLLALVSDVPISVTDSPEFTVCLTDWLDEYEVTPIYLSGLDGTVEADDDGRSPELYGLSTGDGDALLDEAGIVPPRYAGIVTGPAGALLNRAVEVGLDSVGLVVESGDEFPDIEAARIVLEHGIEPLVGVDVDTEPFVDGSIELSAIAESVLAQLRQEAESGSRAQPTPMFH